MRRYQLEYQPNPDILAIHTDERFTRGTIQRFTGKDVDTCEKEVPPLVRDIFSTIPGITEVWLQNYKLDLVKGRVFLWSDIVVDGVIPVLQKHLGAVEEIIVPEECEEEEGEKEDDLAGDLIKQRRAEMKGYVVQCESGEFLAKGLYWFGHRKPERAWVHPESTIQEVRVLSKDWDHKPTKIYPAEYTPETGTVITGSSQPF